MFSYKHIFDPNILLSQLNQHKYVLQKYKFVTAEPTNPSKTAKQSVELTKAPPNLPNPSQPFQTLHAILNSRYWLQLCGLGWDVSSNCLYWHLKGKHIQELNCLWRYINHPFGVIFVIVKQILPKTSESLYLKRSQCLYLKMLRALFSMRTIMEQFWGEWNCGQPLLCSTTKDKGKPLPMQSIWVLHLKNIGKETCSR